MIEFKLSEDQAFRLYHSVTDESIKNILEQHIPILKMVPVTERVKTFEDACKVLGREPYDEKQLAKLGLPKNDIAYLKMVVIVEALNEGWKPDVCNSGVERWYPWFKPNGSPSSFAFVASLCDHGAACAGSGSRLALKSEQLASYCGKQFLELWKEILL